MEKNKQTNNIFRAWLASRSNISNNRLAGAKFQIIAPFDAKKETIRGNTVYTDLLRRNPSVNRVILICSVWIGSFNKARGGSALSPCFLCILKLVKSLTVCTKVVRESRSKLTRADNLKPRGRWECEQNCAWADMQSIYNMLIAMLIQACLVYKTLNLHFSRARDVISYL